MCVCSEEYIFLGSRLGNSLLVRFTEKDQNTVITIDDSDILGKEKERGSNPRAIFVIFLRKIFNLINNLSVLLLLLAALFRDKQAVGRRIRSVW